MNMRHHDLVSQNPFRRLAPSLFDLRLFTWYRRYRTKDTVKKKVNQMKWFHFSSTLHLWSMIFQFKALITVRHTFMWLLLITVRHTFMWLLFSGAWSIYWWSTYVRHILTSHHSGSSTLPLHSEASWSHWACSTCMLHCHYGNLMTSPLCTLPH